MKRLICSALALLLLLCGCSAPANIIAEYSSPDALPSCYTRLYPEKSGDERYAVLLRKFDETDTKIAVCDGIGGELKEVYSLPEGTFSYELYAGGGLIAFYQLISYTDGSVDYDLKAIDTENGNRVHSVFRKTVSDISETQTRFIAVFGGCVYYLTSAAKLGRCRIMKYDAKTEELSEFQSFAYTSETATGGVSCTFLSCGNGYLTCGVTDAVKYFIKTYNLRTGELSAEKILRDVSAVFYAGYDDMTGIYAIYYAKRGDGSKGDERVGIATASSDGITDVFTDLTAAYICRDTVAVYNNLVVFNVEAADKDDPYGSFYGVMLNMTDRSNVAFKGSFQLFIKDNEIYSLSFDKKSGYGKVSLSKTEIR